MYGNNTSTSQPSHLLVDNRNKTNDTSEKDATLLCIAILEMLITIAGCIGNLLISVAIVRNKHLQVSANFYVLTLSIADLLVCGVLVPMRAAQHISIFNDKSFPSSAVNIIVFIGKATILISIATLGALSIDRFIAMKHPFLYRTKLRHSKMLAFAVSLLIWLVSFSLPALSKIPGVTNKDTLLVFVGVVVSMTIVIVLAYYNVYKIMKRQTMFRKRSTAVVRRSARETRSSTTNTTSFSENDSGQTTGSAERNETLIDGRFHREGRTQSLKTDNKRMKIRFNSDTSPLLKKFNYTRESVNSSGEKSLQFKDENGDISGTKTKYNSLSYSVPPFRKGSHQKMQTKLVCGQGGRKKSIKHIFSNSKNSWNFDKQRKMDQKISIMIALVITSFMVLVFPRIILVLYHVAAKETPTTKLLRLWSRLLIYLNSALNPLLYAWRLKEFRQEFRRLIKRKHASF